MTPVASTRWDGFRSPTVIKPMTDQQGLLASQQALLIRQYLAFEPVPDRNELKSIRFELLSGWEVLPST